MSTNNPSAAYNPLTGKVLAIQRTLKSNMPYIRTGYAIITSWAVVAVVAPPIVWHRGHGRAVRPLPDNIDDMLQWSRVATAAVPAALAAALTLAVAILMLIGYLRGGHTRAAALTPLRRVDNTAGLTAVASCTWALAALTLITVAVNALEMT